MSEQDPLAGLVRAGGRRPVPDPERAARARVAVRAEWQAAVARRNTQRWRWVAAATLTAAVSGVGVLAVLRPSPVPAIASLTRVSGEVVRRADGGSPSGAVLSGNALYAGDEIETSSTGRALLRWSDSATLRIDSASLARFESESELRLMRGTLYVETSGDGDARAPLAVSTPFGEVRHVGTRFEVQVSRDQVRVRVRDGIAIFAGNAFAPVVIEAGRQLSIGGGEATLQAGPAASDPAWGWTQTIAPEFAIEGRSLFDALEWLAHEAGLRVIYASPVVRDRTRTVVLHGSIDGLDLRQALTAVLSGSGVSFQLRSDRIEVRESESR